MYYGRFALNELQNRNVWELKEKQKNIHQNNEIKLNACTIIVFS